MARSVSRAIALAFAGLALALTGCGGGGSDGGSSAGTGTGTSGANAPLSITSANAPATAAEIITLNQRLGNAATAPSSGSVSSGSSAVGRARAAALSTTSDDCAVGGSFTTLDTSATQTTVTFSNCAESSDLLLNGSQSYTSLTLATTSNSATLSATIASQMTVSNGGVSYLETGNYAFAFTANFVPLGAVTSETFTLSGTSLSIDVSNNGTPIDTVSMTNFSFNYKQDLTVSPNQLYGSGSFSVASSLLNGSVGVSTPQVFKQINDPTQVRAFPYAGQALMTGANHTHLRMTVLGDETYAPPPGQGQVELEIDPGTGNFGAPIWVNWLGLATIATPPTAATTPPPTYSIGGSVSGLAAGGSLVLFDKGSDPLTVVANGSFAFLSPLPSGAAYAVTVHTQPSGQVCSVGAGSGSVGAAAVTNVAVTCTP